jgi:regulator of protease activity HflC (stomatin/prohibitin superfamily)
VEAAIWPDRRSQRSSLSQNRVGTILTVLVALFVIAASWRWIVVTVPAGHVGVMWYRFAGGTETKFAFNEGTHLVLPWNKMQVYDTRVQQISRDFDVLTQDGLMITVNIAARFRLNDAMVGYLHKTVGPDYVDILLVPAIGSHTRQVFSQNSPESVYSVRRVPIQAEIKDAIMEGLTPGFGLQTLPGAPWLYVQDVLIRSIRFSPDLQAAINRKMEQYQIKEEYSYRLQREELESKRKEVEAQGIARFQSIVGAGISDNYLRWKGIDATLALAQSPNAKVVVIGTPRDGLPLILGGPDGSSPVVANGEERASTGAAINAARRPEAPPTNVAPGPAAELAAAASEATERAGPPSRTQRTWSVFDRLRGLTGGRHRQWPAASSAATHSPTTPSSASSNPDP